MGSWSGHTADKADSYKVTDLGHTSDFEAPDKNQ